MACNVYLWQLVCAVCLSVCDCALSVCVACLLALSDYDQVVCLFV